MVNARSAGVAMTLDPTNGDRSKIVIDSSFGLGETVVGGTVTPDNFVVDKVMLEVVQTGRSPRSTSSSCPTRTAAASSSGQIEAERQLEPSLTLDEVKAVAALAKLAEQHYGCPQDVEWAIDRPATSSCCRAGPRRCGAQKARHGASASLAAAYQTGVLGILGTLINPIAGHHRRRERDRERDRPRRFASPYEDAAPAGAEGWEELYPYFLLFREDRREIEEAKFWFCDSPALAERVQAVRDDRWSSSPSSASASTTRATG